MPSFSTKRRGSRPPPIAESSIRPRRTPSSCAGGCPFAVDPEGRDADAETIPWSARFLPSVTLVTTALETGVDPRLALSAAAQARVPNTVGNYIQAHGGSVFRVTLVETGALPPTVLLPLDDLFDIRAVAAIRLWQVLNNRMPAKNPARLTRQRIDRLILALRALDAKLEGATHRQIAGGLFPDVEISDGGWISHDLRDRTARLVRLGSGLMEGGYKRLLLHPYRRTSKG